MTLSRLRFPVSVTMRRVKVVSRWAEARWEPDAVEPELPTTGAAPGSWGDGAAPGSCGDGAAPRPRVGGACPEPLDDDGGGPRWRFGGFEVELHPSEAEGYYLNVTAPEPKVFVMWRHSDDGEDRPGVPVIVTVSYHQAARMLDGGEQVDALPLPAWIDGAVRRFAAEQYHPEPRRKIRRNDPFRDEAERDAAADP